MLIELFCVFLQLGLFGIGGGLVSVSLLMQQVVTERQWLTAAAFNDLIAIAESTPGPLVVNCATFVGMQFGGVAGAVVSTVASVIPGFLIALVLSLLYQRYRTISPIQGAMDGLRPIVVALIFVGGIKVMRIRRKNTSICSVFSGRKAQKLPRKSGGVCNRIISW